MEFVAFLVIVAIALIGLFGRAPILKIAAHLTTTPQGVEKIRRAMSDACDGFDMGSMTRADAQHQMGELARHAIGRTFAEMNPGKPFEVTKDWPRATVIISGDIAVIEADIGLLLMGQHNEIEPVRVRVKRAGVVTLDNRRPIKDAFEERYTPPPKTGTDGRAPIGAVAAKKSIDRKPVAAPTAKPTPPKRRLT